MARFLYTWLACAALLAVTVAGSFRVRNALDASWVETRNIATSISASAGGNGNGTSTSAIPSVSASTYTGGAIRTDTDNINDTITSASASTYTGAPRRRPGGKLIGASDGSSDTSSDTPWDTFSESSAGTASASAPASASTYAGRRPGGKLIGVPHDGSSSDTPATTSEKSSDKSSAPHTPNGQSTPTWKATAFITFPDTFTNGATTLGTGFGIAALEVVTVVEMLGAPDGGRTTGAITYQVYSPLETPRAGASETVALTLTYGDWKPILTVSRGVGRPWLQEEAKSTSASIPATSSPSPESSGAPLDTASPWTDLPFATTAATSEDQMAPSGTAIGAPVGPDTDSSATFTAGSPTDTRKPQKPTATPSTSPTISIPPHPQSDTHDHHDPASSDDPTTGLLFSPDPNNTTTTKHKQTETAPIVIGALLGSCLLAFLIWWFAYYRRTVRYQQRKVQRKDEAMELATRRKARVDAERAVREAARRDCERVRLGNGRMGSMGVSDGEEGSGSGGSGGKQGIRETRSESPVWGIRGEAAERFVDVDKITVVERKASA